MYMKLLLAEDERALSKALVTILEKNNYLVDAVYNGEDALYFLETGDYDGCILDVMMPKLDGISVLKNIRRKGITVPVLLLTAKNEVEDKVEGLDSGANDYLTKPFQSKELLARIRAMIRSSTRQVDNHVVFGNVILDQNRFILRVGDNEIQLMKKEYQLLELLLKNPRQVITTQRIMEKVWGLESEAELNVVWVYISNLRKKLQSLESNVYIKATRNVGYSIEEI